jgi:hypothetical protein
LYLAVQGFAEIWRHQVAILQVFCAQDELGVGIEDHQVRIVTRGNGAFAVVETGEFGGLRGHPAGQVLERKIACAHVCPDHGDRDTEAGDASPGLAEISVLHRWRARRVIGRDQVDHSVAQPLPQSFAIFSGSDGRGAFVKGSARGNLFSEEVQVVRTGFYREG